MRATSPVIVLAMIPSALAISVSAQPRTAEEHSYDVAPNTDAMLLMPELKNAPAPAFVKPGVQLTYLGGSATIPGSHIVLVPGANGALSNKATGEPFSVEDNTGAGGMGLTQLTVIATHRDAVAAQTVSFLLNNGGQGPLTTVTESGITTTPGAVGDLWINPDVLRKYADLQGQGILSFKTRYKAAGREFNALWRTVSGENSSTTYVYDLDSGLLLHNAMCATTAASNAMINGTLQSTGGGTSLSQATLIAVRQVQSPWKPRLPRVLDGVRRLRYEGSQQVTLPDGNVIGGGTLRVQLSITGRAEDFVQIHREGATIIGNVPIPFSGDLVGGPVQITPVAVDPADLARLQQGQVLDTDPATKMVSTVSFVGRSRMGDVLVVTTAAPGPRQQRVDTVYDRSTGLMVGSAITDPMTGMASQVTLTGKD